MSYSELYKNPEANEIIHEFAEWMHVEVEEGNLDATSINNLFILMQIQKEKREKLREEESQHA